MAANDDVQTCKDMIAAADLIKPLKAQMEGVLADLNAEINTNTALMDPFIAKADETRIALKTAKEEVKKAQEEQDALTAEAEANSKKFAELIQDYTGLISVVQDRLMVQRWCSHWYWFCGNCRICSELLEESSCYSGKIS